MGAKIQGIKLDYRKLRLYLKNAYQVDIAPTPRFSSLLRKFNPQITTLKNIERSVTIK